MNRQDCANIKIKLQCWRRRKAQKFYKARCQCQSSCIENGDFDNLAKAICDSLNGVCYDDDSQIVKCTVEKIQSATPKIEIEIESWQ